MTGLDTNVLLRYLLQDDSNKRAKPIRSSIGN